MSDSASLFADEGQDPLLGKKIVEVSGKQQPTICYIGAAKGDNPDRISQFRRLAERIEAKARILSLFDPPTGNADDFFDGVDIIYIDGGSTRNLLALFREWGVVGALRMAYSNGVLLAGASAGLNILYNWSITDSIKSSLRPIEGLGILDGSVCVHHDAHPERPKIFREFLRHNRYCSFPAFSLDDGVAAYFENEQIAKIFSLSENAHLYSLSKEGGQIIRHPCKRSILRPEKLPTQNPVPARP
ncbi:Type 1 glutamine amidotransferase-like domain-containing protein [Sphingorhabdus sp. Alg239-R122]|uniref:Type 1 glutamine amidotransferase-like domain-containing protein n=1 Tax=Sphingorhabdus sp. Alg239-R122 TaxID=2305989 RepID=UPI0013DBC41E|nr:Type 1 glutamine amidotransferase-like domain-containing protein [Sphingorhabdus sp. Alg239-R122]